MPARRLLLVGGGHAHVEVLRQFGRDPVPGVELTLISPASLTPYSGMLPGLVAGHYTHDDIHIALPPLVDRAGGRFVVDRVVELDVARRRAACADGTQVAFDLVSLDVGSVPALLAEGAATHATPIKPIAGFLAAWAETLAAARAGSVHAIVVVGGLGGCETLLSMQYRLRVLGVSPQPAFHFVCGEWNVSAALASRLERVLERRGVTLHRGRLVRRVNERDLELDNGLRIAADRAYWAVGAAAAPWFAASGLACDRGGFVRIDDHLRSRSHPFVFAAGDCASQDGRPHPRSGVYAVRQGPILAGNLRRWLRDQALGRYVPQRRTLALVATGERSAIAAWGPLAFGGRLVWRWKDAIDRGFVARYRVDGAR